ncbi:MAG: hypothetical protein ACREQ9_27355, partial [Candidatus Binatia bacterium]
MRCSAAARPALLRYHRTPSLGPAQVRTGALLLAILLLGAHGAAIAGPKEGGLLRALGAEETPT